MPHLEVQSWIPRQYNLAERRGEGWSNGTEKWQLENPIVTDRDGSRKLKLTFDVRQFKPEEISVKTLDQHLVIHAQHKEDTDTSKVYREYNRQFLLPASVNPETLKSVLSPEGVMSIEAPVNQALEEPRNILVSTEHAKPIASNCIELKRSSSKSLKGFAQNGVF